MFFERLFSMKKNILALVCSLVSVSTMHAHPVTLARIEREQIAYLESKVAADLANDTFKKRLVFTAAALAGGYLTYRYFNPTPVELQVPPASVDQINLNNALLQQNNEMLRNMLPEMQEAGSTSWLQDSAIGKFGSWMWEIGKWSSQQALIAYMANVMFLGSSSALGKMVKSIDGAVDSVSFNLFHDRDIKWFLISRSRITNLFNELEDHAQSIQTGTVGYTVDVHEQEEAVTSAINITTAQAATAALVLDAATYEYHIKAFEKTWLQLSLRLASLVAFIEHKAHTHDHPSISDRLLLGAQHITQLTNATALQCEQMIATAHIDALPGNLLFEVQRLRSAVSDELMLANKLEHELCW